MKSNKIPPFDPKSTVLKGPNFRRLMAERSSQITVDRLKATKQSEILALGDMGLTCVIAAELADPQKLWLRDLRQAAEECWSWCHLIIQAEGSEWKDVESAAEEILKRVKEKIEKQKQAEEAAQKETEKHARN
jgi:hypothetical protein